MATLPDAQALGERPQVQPSAGVASYDVPNWRTAGMAGQHLERAGGELSAAGSIIDQTNQKYDQIAAEAAYNKLQDTANTLEFDPQAGFRNVQGSGAIGQDFFKDYQGRLSGAAKEIQDGLANQQQRQMFQQRSQIAALQYRSALLQHQARQTEVFASNTEDNSVKVELRNMGANPDSDQIFDAGMARINGIIDAKGGRLGLPAAQTEEMRGQMMDAAWSTRILSKLNDAPYVAEKMLDENLRNLGPQAQVTLRNEVVKGVKQVQQRDIAQALIFGGKKPTDPASVAPAVGDAPPLQGIVKTLEAGTNPDGSSRTSPKGAQGEMQVMPTTATNPGYGVAPAKDDSPEELARVGRDYLGAMTARYQQPALILAAYNAGSGQVDKWIGKFGDPRTGQISPADWAAKIPFAETSKYVTAGMRMVAAANGNPNAPISPPTANEMKTRLPSLIAQARDAAARMYPNDPIFADGVASRVESLGRTVLAQQQATQQAATDQLTRGIVGSAPDGSDKPVTMDDLLQRPGMKQAWDQATPEVQLAIQTRLAKGEKKLTQEGLDRYYQLFGQASTDPAAFKATDLSKEYKNMPDAQLMHLIGIQGAIDKHDAAQQAKDINLTHARQAVEPMLKPVVLATADKEQQAVIRDTFYGKLQDAMQTYHDDPKNGKWPDTATTQKMAAALLTPGQQTVPYWFDKKTTAFQSDDLSKFYVPIPAERKSALAKSYQSAMGRPASEQDLQQWYTKYKLSGGK